MKHEIIAAVEAGGTKFNCAIGTGPDDILASKQILTSDPTETMREVVAFFEESTKQFGTISAFGVASFGPLDLNTQSDTYGYITTTPKPGWKYTDVLGTLSEYFRVPMGFDTDVNAAALAEYKWGYGRHCNPLLYITVGTGIGGGVLVDGRPVHGALHPEIGHMFLPAILSDAPNPDGVCPYHGECLEGLISGPAIAARWGVYPEELPPEHAAWGEFSTLLGIGLVNLILTLSPHRILLGGGVMRQEHLFPMIREEVQRMLNGYLAHREVMEDIDQYIMQPGLGENAGLLGALALGMEALRNR